MSQTIAILQPGYLPWLGFFEMAARVDIFVLYDTVQYDKDSWRNRNRIKTPGGVKWLTVPVRVHGKPLIKEVEIANPDKKNWRESHLGLIRQYYRQTQFFDEYFQIIRVELQKQWQSITDLDFVLIKKLAELIGLPSERFVLASQLDFPPTEGKTEKLVAICRHLSAKRYYATQASRAYIDSLRFEQAGITLEFQNYQHPVYRQLHGEFIPYLSTIDLILNEGPRSLEIIRQGGG